MTRERALELAGHVLRGHFEAGAMKIKIADSILAAVAEENEACTKIAQDMKPSNAIGPLFGAGVAAAANGIAVQIRARGIPLKVEA